MCEGQQISIFLHQAMNQPGASGEGVGPGSVLCHDHDEDCLVDIWQAPPSKRAAHHRAHGFSTRK